MVAMQTMSMYVQLSTYTLARFPLGVQISSTWMKVQSDVGNSIHILSSTVNSVFVFTVSYDGGLDGT